VRTTYAERETLPQLVARLSVEFSPMPVRALVANYLSSGGAWNNRKVVLFITSRWQQFKRELRADE
jgi:hypothetical protein